MSLWTTLIEDLQTRDINDFRDQHHEEFPYIMQDKLVNRDEQCEAYAERYKDLDFTSPLKDAKIISENLYVMEIHWPEKEDGAILILLVLKKYSKIWQTILCTGPKKQSI